MNAPTQQTYFEEQQRFPLWIKAIPLFTVLLCGLCTLALAIAGALAAALITAATLIVVFLPLAVLHFAIRLATRVDTNGLHLRVLPARWSMLPRRMTHKDVPLADLRRWQPRTYNSITGREYWGWHLWGLAAGRRGHYLYVMRPSCPTTGHGVAIELENGDNLFVGTSNPDELARALHQATNKAG
jgi:hypothetical protein